MMDLLNESRVLLSVVEISRKPQNYLENQAAPVPNQDTNTLDIL